MKTYFLDIETSYVITDNNEELQVTYLTNVITLDVDTKQVTNSIFFRNISDTIDYLKTLDENSIVWCHNLDYELTFILRELVPTGATGKVNDMYNKLGQEVVFRDKNAPLSIKLNELSNVTFRDSYALFNTSVKVLGEKLNLPKLDYNYKKIRMPWDELTQLDYDYNERDNLIVAYSLLNYMEDNEYTLENIPLTFTSDVRNKRKKFISENFGKKALTKFYYDRNDSYVSFNLYEALLKVYQGGLTSSAMKQTGKKIDNIKTSGVIGIDIKSSYPNQMCTKKFPLFCGDTYKHFTYPFSDKVYKSGIYKAFIGIAKINNIKVKNDNFILPISTSQLTKGECVGGNYFNGKLVSAESITIPLTNVDLDVINMVYTYDSIEMLDIHITSKMRYLRIEEIAFLLSNFLNKENDINKLVAKLIINSMYGVKVSNPIKDFYTIQNGEIIKDCYFDYNINEREKMFNSFVDSQPLYGGGLDVYSDGVFITSYARHQLVSMIVYIVSNGGYVAYSDTDSCKFFCNTKKEQDELLKKILEGNKEKIKSNSKLPRFKQFKKYFNVSDDDYLKICTLGIWEVEDEKPHKLFKTFGAKKYGYITHDGIVKTTIAGCNKKNIPTVINNVAKKHNMTLEESFLFCFNVGVTYDESASGRTTAHKEDRNYEELQNLTYQGRKINQYGGIIIKDTTYTLNMTLNDSNIIGYNATDIEILKISLEGDVIFE